MSEQLEQIISEDVVWGKAYYEMHEVDAIIAQKNKEIAELKATPHTDNSDVIEKMATEITELKDKLRWRKFPDEKPKWGEEVIVVDDASKQYIVRFSYDMKWISWGNMNTCESKYVKYWMPLPATPKEDK